MNEQQGQGRSQGRALPVLLQSSAGCAASPALGGAKPPGTVAVPEHFPGALRSAGAAGIPGLPQELSGS